MGDPGTVLCFPGAASGWTWPSLDGGAPSARWGAVDLTYGLCPGRSASRRSAALDLPGPPLAWDRVRRVRGGAERPGRRSPGRRPARLFPRYSSFAPAQRGTGVGQTKKGQGSQIRAVVEAHGLPVAVPLDSATPHEVKLVEQTQAARLVENTPAPRMGDKAEDSDRPDADLAPAGIERIAPHRKSRKNRTQKR
jgi:hypothetical protein